VKRAAIALVVDAHWSPPGVDRQIWRTALAEDVVDVLATLAEVDPAIAATAPDLDLAKAVAWPTMPVYELPTRSASAALGAAAADGYDQAVVLASDAADVPAMLIGKLLQPLTTRLAGVAPATGGGLLGVAGRLPSPDWLPNVDLDNTQPGDLRAAAPRPAVVAVTPGWHRLRGPDDLARLDPGLEGWAATRALLGG
jgi:hypothetical protein